MGALFALGHGKSLRTGKIDKQAEAGHAVMQLHLSVNAKNNSARPLHESLGFIAYGTQPRSMRVGNLFYEEHHLALLLK
ncbi:hypothetical protein [Janthinobacterium sp. LB3P118]|uniref:hypothetical protein n=1 Tax=Janthinobacterium sp. LB3P118 TaxID=3424195 RepID=UPI003F254179